MNLERLENIIDEMLDIEIYSAAEILKAEGCAEHDKNMAMAYQMAINRAKKLVTLFAVRMRIRMDKEAVMDFTKEELQIIHLDISTYINKAGVLKVPKHHIDLRDKVERMIDNYCDHILQEMDCDGGISLVCSDCGVTTMDV